MDDYVAQAGIISDSARESDSESESAATAAAAAA